MTPHDETWMRRALQLAEAGRGHVEPNPLVGAVIVRDGKIVGEGWHRKFGEAHAEVNAIAAAGETARNATLYVTLEPCCHHGKTPPCTDAIVRAGIVRVGAALEDPFPQVAGKGGALLRAAGIPIEFGVCANEARRQNAPYFKLLRTGRPYVHAKWAMSLDGKIATKTGHSKWISNEASHGRVHELRGRMDGILVGIGTALADDPLLTARPAGPRTPTRVILDSRGRLPTNSLLARTSKNVPTLLVVNEGTLTSFEGIEVLTLAPGHDGRPDIRLLLDELGRRRWTNLLVEGGAAIHGSFMDVRAVDELHVFVAPKVIGGSEATTAVTGFGVDKVPYGWITDSVENIAGDTYIRCLHPVLRE